MLSVGCVCLYQPVQRVNKNDLNIVSFDGMIVLWYYEMNNYVPERIIVNLLDPTIAYGISLVSNLP